MSASRSVNQLDPTMTAPWTRPDPLPHVEGGETNLLPRSAWADPTNPLRVEFQPWYEVDPPPGVERVSVFLGDDENNVIGSRQWNVPMDPGDYFVEISADKLPQGEHKISFIMTNWLGVPARSFPYTVTVDKQEPLLNASSRLKFPDEVLFPNKLTALYLIGNTDQVEADLPVYMSPRPWDRITWYWGATPDNMERGGEIELTDQNYTTPVVITVSGDLIRNRNDGLRYVWYQVHDRAGNPSLRSTPVELDVAVTPIERDLPPIKIKDAGSGSSSGTLDPTKAVNGVTVTIPPEVVFLDDEVFVQWAEKDSPGSHRTNTPVTPGTREYLIPSDKARYHINRSLIVGYEIEEPGVVEPHRSDPYNLQVGRLSGTSTIQCVEVSGGQLSLRVIPDGGFAHFTLERWTHMGTEQFLTIWVEGVGTDNKVLTIPVLTNAPVPEVAQKIGVGRISKVDLQRFKLGDLYVKVRVSFDGKLTWQSFTTLEPKLVP